MTRKQLKSIRKRSSKNQRKSGSGDVPTPADHTYHTQSCPLPRVTETTVIRAMQNATITASATTAQTTTYNFALNNFNVTTGYYDQYRLDAVRFTITPQNNAVGLVTNSTTVLVPLYCVIDYDDDTALASVAAAESYSNVIALSPGESLERIFQPHMAIAAYAGAFTNFANFAPVFIDAVSSGVRHYGIKTYVPAAQVGQTLLQSWNVVIEGFFTMRKVI